ncbi:MAG: LysR family transcriptional regulator, partial [Pseudorhodoplanes sp.]
MTNIPTELLRTLVAVVDLRSFTKAAHSLGITQPAVSAQIKRLQVLLGSELLDKSAPGVSLTSAGEVVVGYARQLLSINDQILDLSSPVALAHPVRIGMTGDFVAAALASCLPRIRKAHPELSFRFQSGGIDPLLRALREAELDLVVGLLSPDSVPEARYRWSDEMVWLSRAAQPLHLNND